MNDKPKKPQKLRARLPRGFGDRTAADIHATNEMVAKIREVYERYGFDPIETPQFEYTDALGKFLPDSDRPNEGVFSLQDDDEQWMSLRYDLTAPLARHVAENFNEIQLPYRTYRQGYVFRNEKPGPGRFRQFMQFDADSVGAPGVQSDAEMCMMMADTLEALGIKRGDYVIRVNNRKVLDGVMEAIGLGGEEHSGKRLNVLRAIDKLDKFPASEIRKLLGSGRWDGGVEGQGDFAKGAGLDQQQIEAIMRFFGQPESIKGLGDDRVENSHLPVDDMQFVEEPDLNLSYRRFVDNVLTLQFWEMQNSWGPANAPNELLKSGLDQLKEIATLCYAGGYGTRRIQIDTSVVRGLEYYTGPVYEAVLTKSIPNEKGEKVVFGSVGGGGRYDGLVSRFMGQPVPATGFSIGVSRLMTALKNIGKLGQDEVLAPVLVTVMDSDVGSLGGYQKLTQALRGAGIRAEMYQGSAKKKIGDQLKYADRRGCSIAIIQGGNERAEGVVQIKDLIEGKRLSGEIEDNASWREARVAQEIVPEAEVVTRVQAMLAAQAEDRKRAMQGPQA